MQQERVEDVSPLDKPFGIQGDTMDSDALQGCNCARWRRPKSLWGRISAARRGVIFVLAMLWTAAAPAQQVEQDRDAAVTRAVVAADQLWLRTDQGELSTIRVNGEERVLRPTPMPVADLCAYQGQVLALSRRDDGAWVLYRPDGAERDRIVIGPVAPSDGPMLDCRGGVITVIGSGQLATLDRFGADAVPRVIALKGEVRGGLTTAVYGDANRVYVGMGNGEFGGGFWVVDRRSGEVTGGGDGKDLLRACREEVGSYCSPVNGMASLPWKRDCVAVAVGLQHFLAQGALIEACGTSFRPLYETAFISSWLRGLLHGKPPKQTVPFYGLVAKATSLLAAGMDGLYEIGPNGAITIARYPPFTRIGGVDVSFERGDVILVRSTVSQRKAVSAEIPLMVPR